MALRTYTLPLFKMMFMMNADNTDNADMPAL